MNSDYTDLTDYPWIPYHTCLSFFFLGLFFFQDFYVDL